MIFVLVAVVGGSGIADWTEAVARRRLLHAVGDWEARYVSGVEVGWLTGWNRTHRTGMHSSSIEVSRDRLAADASLPVGIDTRARRGRGGRGSRFGTSFSPRRSRTLRLLLGGGSSLCSGSGPCLGLGDPCVRGIPVAGEYFLDARRLRSRNDKHIDLIGIVFVLQPALGEHPFLRAGMQIDIARRKERNGLLPHRAARGFG